MNRERIPHEHRIRGDLTVILTAVDVLAASDTLAVAGPLADIRAAVTRIAAALDGDGADATAGSTVAPPTGLQLLCVDDDADNLALLEVVLTAAGVGAVDTCTSVDEAKAALGRRTYDAVVLDWYLGEESSEGLVASVTAAVPRAAVLVLTGDPEVRDEALAAGADEVAIKPIDIDELLGRLATALVARRSRR